MPEIRFATAQALFETFPQAPYAISAAPTDAPPLKFLQGLVAAGKLKDAVAFCSYLLPRREAVWWACRSVRALGGEKDTTECLRAAEAWVQEPNPQHRMAAEEAAARADHNVASTWLALAAAWSGGVMKMGGMQPIAPPPELTAHAARVAILLGARHIEAAKQTPRLRACIEDGAMLAETGL